MALINRADPVVLAERLASWIDDVRGVAGTRVENLHAPSGSGLSNEIFLFDAVEPDGQTSPLVARISPQGEALFPVYDLHREYQIMAALAGSDVPLPRLLGVETDSAVLGQPFLVMEQVDGLVPTDDPPFTVTGWVVDMDHQRRSLMCENALRAIASVHAVDWRKLGLESLDRPQYGALGVDQELGYLEYFAEWTLKGAEHPIIERSLAWLRAHQPTDEPVVLCWGDARPGNMIFGADLGVVALLDWEMASLSSPDQDLGLYLFTQRFHTEGIGVPLPAGLLDQDAVARFYERISGHAPRHVLFYEAMAGVRTAVVLVRFASFMIAAGILPADSDMAQNNPATHLLAAMLNLPAPTTPGTNFVGQRD